MRRPPVASLTFALAFACTQDSGLNARKNEVETGDPDLVVSPDALDLTGLCGESEQVLTLTNAGLGILHVEDVRLDAGNGWRLGDVSLPIDIPAGQVQVLSVFATEGRGTLFIDSDDPEDPTTSVELSAEGNVAPRVTILTPSDGDLLPETGDVTLTGNVGDDLDIPPDITVEWSSSLDGVLSTGTASPDGSTSYAWPAAGRTMGPQTITLTATDTCGNVGTTTVDLCQAGIETYDALGLDGWHFEGSAAYDDESGWLSLTTTDPINQVGTAFETSEQVDAGLVNIDFYVYMGDGTGADGISLTALDVTRMESFQGGTGCGIGYGGGAACTGGPPLPGWSLEIDTFRNETVDFGEADHLAFTFDGDLVDIETYVELPEMENNGWHHVVVDVVAPHVHVSVDDVTYIEDDFDGFYDFPAYVGFTAGTGQMTNNHFIDALQVTDDACD